MKWGFWRTPGNTALKSSGHIDFDMELIEITGETEAGKLRVLLEEIAKIDTAVFGESRWGREAFYENIHNPYDHLIAAVEASEDGTEVSGYALLRVLQDAEVIMIAVKSGMRRQGTGWKLAKRLIELAASDGAESIFLEVRESNIPAIGMYEKLGFTVFGRRKGYYNSPREDALIMRYIC